MSQLNPNDKGSIESSLKEYIKKVFLSFLEYQARGEEKEALLMEKVLMSVLRPTEQELAIVERAR